VSRLTRRSFLTNTAAFALAACLDLPLSAEDRPKSSRRRYLIVTPSYYRKRVQDLGSYGYEKKFPSRKEYLSYDLERTTMLTVVNDDGTGVRRVSFPGLFHSALSAPKHGLIYLSSSYNLALDAETLDIAAYAPMDRPGGDDRRFGGHGALLPGGGEIAFGMNHYRHGRHDSISIRDAKTMKELRAFSSHGFEVHEIRLAPGGKSLVCGHYGSYLGSNVYHDLAVYDYRDGPVPPPKFIYPASVTFVDLESGARRALLSDVQGGQEGHVDADADGNAYLAKHPARVRNRPGVDKNPKFAEGEQTVPDGGEFAYDLEHMGICVAYEPVHREVLVPKRNDFYVEVTNVDTQAARRIDLGAQLDWKRPEGVFIHGLTLHPDGRHYVLSTSDGVIALERGTHRVNPAMTFRLPLLVHTHLHVV
jgi:Protein of unknown function (DUF1513)